MKAGGPEAFPLLEVELASGTRLDGPGSSMLTSSEAILPFFTRLLSKYRIRMKVDRTKLNPLDAVMGSRLAGKVRSLGESRAGQEDCSRSEDEQWMLQVMNMMVVRDAQKVPQVCHSHIDSPKGKLQKRNGYSRTKLQW
jgi:hypothetical protein